MNRVFGGAGGCTDLQMHRAGNSVDIAACKRDDYQVLILLLIRLDLLVHQLRGRVLYYCLPAHQSLLYACVGEYLPRYSSPISWLR